jgi:hypothetical protein
MLCGVHLGNVSKFTGIMFLEKYSRNTAKESVLPFMNNNGYILFLNYCAFVKNMA